VIPSFFLQIKQRVFFFLGEGIVGELDAGDFFCIESFAVDEDLKTQVFKENKIKNVQNGLNLYKTFHRFQFHCVNINF